MSKSSHKSMLMPNQDKKNKLIYSYLDFWLKILIISRVVAHVELSHFIYIFWLGDKIMKLLGNLCYINLNIQLSFGLRLLLLENILRKKLLHLKHKVSEKNIYSRCIHNVENMRTAEMPNNGWEAKNSIIH